MKYEDTGMIPIAQADAANIPINCFLTEPDEESTKWRWTAENFMPRKSIVTEGAYRIESDDKEELLKAVRKYVVPLYKAALTGLKERGECYYWEKKKAQL
jgi:hypothetical protein